VTPLTIEEDFSIKIINVPPDNDILVILEVFPMFFFVITKREQEAMLDVIGPYALHMAVQLHAQKLVETFARARNFGLLTRDLGERME
jgi:hypothetical protein